MADEQERPEDALQKFAHRLVVIGQLHQPHMVCSECLQEWPCSTTRLLDGEPEDDDVRP
jgi:hypothetical protein